MKKLLGFFLVLGMLMAIAGISFSQDFETSLLRQRLESYKNQIKTINSNIDQLNAKLKKTKARQSIAAIQKQINQQQKSAEVIKKDMAEVEKKLAELTKTTYVIPTAKSAAPIVGKNCSLVLGGGLGGGAATVGLGYYKPIASDLDLGVSTGYGVGQDYLLVAVQGEGIIKINSTYFVGLSVDLANYSTKVLDIPGLTKTTDKGNHIGVGAFAGMRFNDWQIKAGYSSALGILLSGGYRLNI